jgi:hypothetical protein
VCVCVCVCVYTDLEGIFYHIKLVKKNMEAPHVTLARKSV